MKKVKRSKTPLDSIRLTIPLKGNEEKERPVDLFPNSPPPKSSNFDLTKEEAIVEASLAVYIERPPRQGRIVFVVGGTKFHSDDENTLFGLDSNSISRLIEQTFIKEFYVGEVMFLTEFITLKTDVTTMGLVLIFHDGVAVGRRKTKRAYHKFLNMLSTVLKREEEKSQYLSNSIHEIVKHNKNNSTWQEIEKNCVANIGLCQHFDHIVKKLRLGKMLDITINHSVILGFLFPKDESVDYVTELRIHQAAIARNKTILQELLTNFPSDGAKDIKYFMGWISPTSSIMDISRNHILSVSLVTSIARHLLDWKALKLIPKLTDNSLLVSTFKEEVSLESIDQFKESFPTFPSLLKTLHKMSIPKTMSNHFLSTFLLDGIGRDEFDSGIIWLIENNFVKQIQTFVHFLLPEIVNSDQNIITHKKVKPRDRKFSKLELECLEKRYKKEDIMKLSRLIGFFNGDYSLQEISESRNISLESLKKFVEYFKDIVITYNI